MSDRNFSRRRRGMRFRPTGGLGHGQQRTDREATQARAEAVGGPPAQDKVYDQRHTHEIDRAENIAAGLPPEQAPPPVDEAAATPKRNFREPNLATPAQLSVHNDNESTNAEDTSHGRGCAGMGSRIRTQGIDSEPRYA